MLFTELMQRIVDLKQQEIDIRYLLKLPSACDDVRSALTARLREVREEQ